jgi:hypothetical protein
MNMDIVANLRDSYDSKKLLEYHKKVEQIQEEIKTHELEMCIDSRKHKSKNFGVSMVQNTLEFSK